jgi:hypothetical protein
MQNAIAERGADPALIRDVGYGTEFDVIQKLQTENLRPRLGLKPDDFVVLSVGDKQGAATGAMMVVTRGGEAIAPDRLLGL